MKSWFKHLEIIAPLLLSDVKLWSFQYKSHYRHSMLWVLCFYSFYFLDSFCCNFQRRLYWAVCQSWQADGWIEYSVHYFSSPWGLPLCMPVHPSTHLSIHPSVCQLLQMAQYRYTWIAVAKRGQKRGPWKRLHKTVKISNVSNPVDNWRFKQQPVKATILL